MRNERIIKLRDGGDVMIYSIVNANHDDPKLDIKLSELIYGLESKNIQVNNLVLKHLKTQESYEGIHDIISLSDMAFYVCPLDSQSAVTGLMDFLEQYDLPTHPAIYLILDAQTTLSVETVTDFIDVFEHFASQHNSKIIDVQYFKDAKEALQ